MIMFLGYNFLRDINAVDPVSTLVDPIHQTEIRNGIFDHLHVSKDVTSDFSVDIPEDWDYNTIMDADFENNIQAGNIDFLASAIDSIRVKRRIVGTFDWVILKTIPINDVEDLIFSFNDNLATSLHTYEYAFVPVVGGVEGDYITNTIDAEFDGVFIADFDTIYKLYSNVQYGQGTQVQQIGVFNPLGREKPVVVSNGMINYFSNTVSGRVFNPEFFITREIDRLKLVVHRDAMVDFITNKKAKILKDWNGKSWLVMVSGSPTISYDNLTQAALADVTMPFVEMGNPESQDDLVLLGILTED